MKATDITLTHVGNGLQLYVSNPSRAAEARLALFALDLQREASTGGVASNGGSCDKKDANKTKIDGRRQKTANKMDAVLAYVEKHGKSKAGEITDAVGFSRGSVNMYLGMLCDSRKLKRSGKGRDTSYTIA